MVWTMLALGPLWATEPRPWQWHAVGPAAVVPVDVAVHPHAHQAWAVVTASGAVWRTESGGRQWQRVLSGEASLSADEAWFVEVQSRLEELTEAPEPSLEDWAPEEDREALVAEQEARMDAAREAADQMRSELEGDPVDLEPIALRPRIRFTEAGGLLVDRADGVWHRPPHGGWARVADRHELPVTAMPRGVNWALTAEGGVYAVGDGSTEAEILAGWGSAPAYAVASGARGPLVATAGGLFLGEPRDHPGMRSPPPEFVTLAALLEASLQRPALAVAPRRAGAAGWLPRVVLSAQGERAGARRWRTDTWTTEEAPVAWSATVQLTWWPARGGGDAAAEPAAFMVGDHVVFDDGTAPQMVWAKVGHARVRYRAELVDRKSVV